MTRLGIFGGTFDPVHYGHLLLAETARQELQLDQVFLIPARVPPHKKTVAITDGHTRADMLQLAVSGCPEFRVDRRELRRDGPSFTVDTVSEFAAEFPEAERFLLLGADSLRDFLTWRLPQKIAELTTVVGVNRPGLPVPTPDQVQEWVGADVVDRVRILAMPGTDLASTDLRQRVREGRPLRFLTPRAVEVFIQEHGLYNS